MDSIKNIIVMILVVGGILFGVHTFMDNLMSGNRSGKKEIKDFRYRLKVIDPDGREVGEGLIPGELTPKRRDGFYLKDERGAGNILEFHNNGNVDYYRGD